MTISEPLILRPIQPGDSVAGFSVGKKEYIALKIFLKKCAKDFHQGNIAKSYVIVPESGNPKVYGYITIMCSEITLTGGHSIDDCPEANKYETFPAVKIARLAIDSKLQKMGIGKNLTSFAISIAKESILPNVGCRFLIVDSKKSAVRFYEKVGFTILNTEKNKKNKNPILFLDLHKI